MSVEALIKLRNNVDYTFSCTAANGDTPVDLTGGSLAMQVRRKAADAAVVFTPVVTITGAPAGTFNIEITKEMLEGQTGVFDFDLVLTVAGGDKTTVMFGKLQIDQGVTR